MSRENDVCACVHVCVCVWFNALPKNLGFRTRLPTKPGCFVYLLSGVCVCVCVFVLQCVKPSTFNESQNYMEGR